MDARTLSRARTGDEEAFRELVEPYHGELRLHCYRILGSIHDAEDHLQETLLAAWRGLPHFDGRSSVRTWLYRIATNRCLNALRARGRRPRRVEPMPHQPPEPTRRDEPLWLEPYPDALLATVADDAPGPEARYELREAVGLAFVTALQRLPGRQRVVLVLRDVLGFRAAEVADLLQTSEPAVQSALQRARAGVGEAAPTARERAPLPGSQQERELAGRFADAVGRGDVRGVVALLTDDAWLTMPPQPFAYQGATAIAAFLDDRALRRGQPLRVLPTRANGQPAFGCYLPDADGAVGHPYGLLVLTLQGERISAITWFADRRLFGRFGLPEAPAL